MGMFDYVNVGKELPCIGCGEPIPERDWQSKDRECILSVIPVDEVNNFYASCGYCGQWNEYWRHSPKSFIEYKIPTFTSEEWDNNAKS